MTSELIPHSPEATEETGPRSDCGCWLLHLPSSTAPQRALCALLTALLLSRLLIPGLTVSGGSHWSSSPKTQVSFSWCDKLIPIEELRADAGGGRDSGRGRVPTAWFADEETEVLEVQVTFLPRAFPFLHLLEDVNYPHGCDSLSSGERLQSPWKTFAKWPLATLFSQLLHPLPLFPIQSFSDLVYWTSWALVRWANVPWRRVTFHPYDHLGLCVAGLWVKLCCPHRQVRVLTSAARAHDRMWK